MLIKVKQWLQEKPLFEPYEENIDFSSYDFDGYKVQKPASVYTSISYTADGLAISLVVKAQVQTECARCLKPLTKDYTIKKHYIIRSSDLEDEDTEFPFTQVGNLETAEMAYQELVTTVPFVLLCKKDCEGLCPSCGHLHSECICSKSSDETEQAIDPRLAPLLDLLS